MRSCPRCEVEVEGSWTLCPLCTGPLRGAPTPDPLPVVPLVFSRRRLMRILVLASLAVIAVSFGLQLLIGPGREGIGVLRSLWLGLTTLWLLVLIAVRQRRDITGAALSLVVIVSATCACWDYLTGWHGWSLTYTVPTVCTCAVIGVLVVAQVLDIEIAEHLAHSGPIVLLGLVPVLFWLLGWTTDAIPSILSGTVSLVALAVLHLSRGADVRQELARRLHL